jgi:hypothetical protein
MKIITSNIKSTVMDSMDKALSKIQGGDLLCLSDDVRATCKFSSIKSSWLSRVSLPTRRDNIITITNSVDPGVVSWVAEVSSLLNH